MSREDYMLKPFRENADLIAERTRNGIENYRKGFGSVRVTDSEGKPVQGAEVRFVQKTHDFHYGANIFMLDEFETEEKNAQFREVFKKYFNFATLPFYWDTLEPIEGQPRYAKDSPRIYRRPAPDLCLEYCEANGITPKAHCLHYDHFEPQWLKKYDTAHQWLKLEERFAQCAERYKNRIPAWEVTNESYWTSATTNMYYDPLYMEKSFALARRYFPVNELICNEGGEPFRGTFLFNRNNYFMQVERAKLKGAEIDTVGFQYHIWCNTENEADVVRRQFDPVNMYRVFDTFATLNTPFQITEVTFPCHDPESREAENVQAEVLENLYKIWFGVPNMEAVIYWNLPDGYAHNAKPGDFTAGENRLAGGLLRFDMTPKPAADVLYKLFHETWHTDVTVGTNADGRAKFKGFYGEYDMIVTANGKQTVQTVHLEKANQLPVTFTAQI